MMMLMLMNEKFDFLTYLLFYLFNEVHVLNLRPETAAVHNYMKMVWIHKTISENKCG